MIKICHSITVPSISQTDLDTYNHTQLLKLKLIVSITNIGPGCVLPQGYWVTHNSIWATHRRCRNFPYKQRYNDWSYGNCNKLQTIAHVVNDCIIQAYAGRVKEIHQASLNSAEWFSNLGLNLQSVIAFQNAIRKKGGQSLEIQVPREEKNKQTNSQTSSHFNLCFHGIINFNSPHLAQPNLRENGHYVKWLSGYLKQLDGYRNANWRNRLIYALDCLPWWAQQIELKVSSHCGYL